MRRSKSVISLTIFLALSAFAQEHGDPKAGLAYARQVCADCHAVQAGETVSINIKAPSFATVANSGLVTQREIIGWLVSSHEDMPDLKVPADKRDDVVAYIMSLRVKLKNSP